MNELLKKAEKWLAELGIRTIACPTCLMVNKDDVVNLCGAENAYQTILAELRSSLGSNKFSFYQTDKEWLYLDTM